MNKTVLSILLSVLFLASCSSSRSNIATATPIIPTQTPALTRTPTPSVTPTPIPIEITEIFNLGKGSANDIAWSPDGKLYAVGGSLGVHLFDAKTSKEISFIPLELAVIISFSPDSQLLGVESADYIRIVNVTDGKILVEIKGLTTGHIAFAPNSRTFAYVLGCWERECNDSIHIWDIETNKEILAINIQPATEIITFSQISFNPAGTDLVGAGSDNMVYVWDVSSGKLKFSMKGHTKQVVDLQFSPANGNLLASSSDDGTVRLWNIEQNKTIKILSGFQGKIKKLTFSSDGSTFEVFTDNLVQTFDTVSWKRLSSKKYADTDSLLLQELRSNGGYIEFVDGFAYSPDGRTLAVGSYASSPILLWDIATKQIKATLETKASRLIYSHQGLLLASVDDDDGNISVWDMSNYAQLKSIKTSPVDSIVFSPDDLNIAFSSEGKIIIWNIQQDKIVQTINTDSEKAILLTYASDGNIIYAVDESSFLVRAWSTSTKEMVLSFAPPENPDYRQAVNLSNDVLAIFEQTDFQNNVIELWDIVSGEKIQEFKGINDYMYPRLTYSPDRKVVAISYFYGITFYCSNTGKPIYIYDKEVNWVKFSFSPDGNYLAIGDSDGNIRLWDVSRIVQASSCANP